MSSITITFGDQAQNHKGMQIIGSPSDNGFTLDELESAKLKFEKQGFQCQLVNLNKLIKQQIEAEQAYLLVVRKGVECLVSDKGSMNELFEELVKLDWDSKAFMYGRVVTKHARHNLCFADYNQDPDYQNGKGRIIAWKSIPLLNQTRIHLQTYFNHADKLAAQGNYYYDNSKCGIGFHGDSQRKKVIAFRLCNGLEHPIHFQWFKGGKPIGERGIIKLSNGDLYVMSEKAVGTDWKKKKIPTLRHATGSDKFTKI